jgi:DnaJ-domain-containing protein 1
MLKQKITLRQWNLQWETAIDVPNCLGLLHSLPNIEIKNLTQKAEIILFLLKLSEDPEDIDSRIISNKAPTVLAWYFFKEGINDLLYFPPQVLTDVLHFFRTQLSKNEVRRWNTERKENLSHIRAMWKKFDSAALAKLEQIALQDSSTIEKACFKGSESAHFLILVRTALKEIDRQERIEALKEKAEAAQRALAEAL